MFAQFMRRNRYKIAIFARCKARALIPSWFMVLRIKALLVSSSSQYSRMCPGPTLAPHATPAAHEVPVFWGSAGVSALPVGPLPSNRASCLLRGQHALPHSLARFIRAIAGEFLVIDTRHIHTLRVSKRSGSRPATG